VGLGDESGTAKAGAMNNATKYQLKIFARDVKNVDADRLMPVFHGWIRDKKITDELLIDVADYTHVPDGPGVALIGHEADYFLDEAEGRPGLVYAKKRGGGGDVAARLADVFERALDACVLLESDATLGYRFGTSEMVLRIADRLNAPNEAATYETVEPELRKLLDKLLGGRTYRLERAKDPREVFTLRIHVEGDEDVGKVTARI
jgi:hypothetical protein